MIRTQTRKAILAISFGSISAISYLLGGCGVNRNCFSEQTTDFLDGITFPILEPTFIFFLCLFLASLLFFFVREEIFRSWLRFSYWWIPLSVFIMAISPTVGHGWAIGNPTRETISWFMGGLFLCISLSIIAWKSWRLRGK